MSLGRFTRLLVAVVLPAAACEGRLAQRPVEPAPELPAPSCGAGVEALPEGEVVAEATLVPGSTMRAEGLVERYRVLRRDCLLVGEVTQETPLGRVRVEAVFDDGGRPMRVERWTSVPGRADAEDRESIELRGDVPRLVRHTWEGHVEHRELRGGTPVAVVGPGRGLLTVWIRTAGLGVGEKVRGPILDLTGYARIRDATLRRDADRDEATMGRTVQVHTVYGRDSVFTDASGRVIGDLAGLRTDPARD